jgi:dephospho-CoA kinase
MLDLPGPFRVALTGGIATGKSYIARRMSSAGLPVVDADVLARDAVAPGTPGLAAVASRFGVHVLRPDGSLDRARLAEVVFQDPRARENLEAIVHPAVRAAIEQFFAALPSGAALGVADIPLLFETRRERDFDVVVVAACPREIQIARVMARDDATREQAERRLAAQLPIEEKVRRADHVIDTSGEYAATDVAIDRVIEALRARVSNPQHRG